MSILIIFGALSLVNEHLRLPEDNQLSVVQRSVIKNPPTFCLIWGDGGYFDGHPRNRIGFARFLESSFTQCKGPVVGVYVMGRDQPEAWVLRELSKARRLYAPEKNVLVVVP